MTDENSEYIKVDNELSKSRGLITKLCEVMDAINRIPKRGENPHFHYAYATEGDVSDAIRSELASRNVMFFSSITDIQLNDNIATIKTLHEFVDGDTMEVKAFTWSSQGQDGQDKGVSKAATSAVKYALLKAFLIPTGDDPDADVPLNGKKAETRKVTEVPGITPPKGPIPIGIKGQSTEPRYASQKASEATVAARAWFNKKMREKFGLEHEDAAKLLGITSFTKDMPNHSLGQLLDALSAKTGIK